MQNAQFFSKHKGRIFLFVLIISVLAVSSGSSIDRSFIIPDTGQEKCYDNTNEIPCPAPGEDFYGQDGNYLINPPSFTKLDSQGDPLPLTATEWVMVQDNVTGLIWEVKNARDGTQDYTNSHDADNTYAWYDSNPATNGGYAGYTNNNINTEEFIRQLNQDSFGGFSDWRMPDRNELKSIVDHSKYIPAAYDQFFPKVMSAFYWSSTSYAYYTGDAWGVYFYNGYDYNYAKDSSYFVRAVRGGQSGSFGNLVINSDNTITDTKTGLMWQKNRTPEYLSWQQAIHYCETLNESDHHNWRLPTINELLSITDLRKEAPAVDANYFSNVLSTFYWSSTSYARYTGYAWGVNFNDGDGNDNAKDSSYFVRAVRGGQCRLFGHLAIWSPNQASKWIIGEEMSIIWDTQNIPGNVQISLSRQGGRDGSFEIIQENANNNGTFTWLITGPSSVNCVLKIIPLEEPDKETSQSFFSVVDETPPILSHIDDQYIASAATNKSIHFSVSDTNEDPIMIWGKSSNESVLSNEKIDLGGNNPDNYTSTTASGGIKKLTMVTDSPFDTAGTTTITLTAYDAGLLTDTTTFEVVVPISTILPQRAFINEPHAVSFSIYNDKYTAESLVVTAHSSNTGILPDSELNINGSGNDRILSIPPVNAAPFICDINIIVSDSDGLTVSQKFQYTVLDTPGYQTCLPDSGQTQCYYDTREIACPEPGDDFFGSDANDTINQPAFTKLDAMGSALMITATEWSMVRDNNTGLIWEVKTNDGSIHDRSNKYTWYDSNPATNGGNTGYTNNNVNTEAFIQQLNQNNFGGFSDWRMPDRNELKSIVDHSKYIPAAYDQFFPKVMSAFYWSSTSYANDTGRAWGVRFYYGYDYNYAKASSYYVRAVRGGQSRSFGNLVINSDNTITDTKTGLMWQKNGIPESLSWLQAIHYCETLNESDLHNWRLPSINELFSITDLRKFSPAADANYFSDVLSAFYWSSTSSAHYTGGAWGVDFGHGGADGYAKDSSYFVRAVRGGQSWFFDHLIIWSPNQASKWTIGSEMPIVWDTQLITGNVQMSLSRKGGKEDTFDILEETENDGLFNWSVTGPASVNCVLKIIPLDEPDKETSQSLFSIVDETPPTISQIETQHVKKNSACDITFTVSDPDNGSLMVWANSSNPTLVANENIDLGGVNPSFYTTTTANAGVKSIPMTFSTSEDITGTTTITLTVYDCGFLTSVAQFIVKTLPPELSQIPDIHTEENMFIIIPISVKSSVSPPESLVLTLTSSNTDLFFKDFFTISGSGENRTITGKPSKNATGSSTITLTASDPNGLTTQQSFQITVYSMPIQKGFPIPDTGQTRCFDNQTEISCPQPYSDFYGQDAHYLINAPAYIKLDAQGNALPSTATQWIMVEDTVTGLVWEVKTNDESIHDKDNRYTWYDSNPETNGGASGTAGNGTDTEDFIQAINAESFGGYTDWRMPAEAELESLLNISKFSPSIDDNYFPNTMSDNYWSSTTFFVNSNSGRYVSFAQNGSYGDTGKQNSYFVRAVRGKSTFHEARLYMNDDNTFTDINTGLMWQYRYADTEMTWQDSLSYCQNLSLGEYSDWRLPNVKELITLVNYGAYEAGFNQLNFFKNFEATFQTSSTTENFPDMQNIIKMSNYNDFFYKTDKGIVHAVRGGQTYKENHLFIISPAQGSAWKTGSLMKIAWEPHDITGNVQIRISRQAAKDGSFETISDQTENDGYYAWNVTAPASTNCVLEIIPSSDSEKKTSQSFFSIVDETPPSISIISNQSIAKNITSNPISFTVVDYDGGDLQIWAHSSNTLLITHENILLSGSDQQNYTITKATGTPQNLSLKIIPESDQTGTATITLSVYDSGFLKNVAEFDVEIRESIPPEISSILSQKTYAGEAIAVTFTVSSADMPTSLLIVNAESSNTALIPNSNIEVNGSGEKRTLIIKPTEIGPDVSFITLTVSDINGAYTSTKFQVTVLKFSENDGHPLSDSGQTKCYDNVNEIPCPLPGENFYGQDGTYTINEPSFTKLDAQGNALMLSATEWTMVRDNITGLIWEVKTDDGSIHDKDNSYSWYDSNPETNGGNAGYTNNNVNTEAFIQQLNKNNFGGFSDWRMPDRNELKSIVDYSNIGPSAFEQFFPKVMSAFYWSSSSYVSHTDDAWGAHFYNGYGPNAAKAGPHYVRAARVGQSGSFGNLVINSDNTITDTKTGLMWQKNTTTERLSWQEAINHCETLNEYNHHNWRLPTIKELLSITDLRKFLPAADTNYFSDVQSAFYWSSSSHVYDINGIDGAWGVNFSHDYNRSNAKYGSYYVRAVRGGQSWLFGHLIIWSPTQGSKWTIGSEMPIVWDIQLIQGNVQISLSRQGGKEDTFEILEETENDGLFNWSVTGPASVNCVLKIIPLDEPDKETSQSLFSIVDETSPTISHIDNQYVPKNSASNSTFTVSDSDNGSLMVWANSSNPILVANDKIDLGGMNPSFYTTTTGGITSIPMTITPAENITGTTTITLTTYDAGFLTDVTHFTLNVGNIPPEALNASFYILEDTMLSANLQGTSPDNSAILTYLITEEPLKGIVTHVDQHSGAFAYTPNANATGLDTFNFKVSDGALDSNIATVIVAITPVNDVPVISNADQTIELLEDLYSMPIVLFASDVDNDPLEYSITTMPAHGIILPAGAANTFIYSPNVNYFGNDEVRYQVSDGIESVVGRIRLNITPVNDPPVAFNQQVSTVEEKSIHISLNAIDIETENLSYEIVMQPQHGVLDEAFVYTPLYNYYGTDSLSFRVYDGELYSESAEVLIEIENVKDLPEISTIQSQKTYAGEPFVLTFTVSSVDVQAYSLIVNAESSNTALIPDSNLEIKGSGNERTLIIKPTDIGPDVSFITLTVSDINGAYTSTKFQVSVLKFLDNDGHPLSDSGQTKCYDNENEIPCPLPGDDFYGQDAHYTINEPSFTKLDAQGNALMLSATEWTMVRDNITGLIWEVKTDDGSIHDKDNKYSWYDSNPKTNSGNAGYTNNNVNTEMFIQQLNQDHFGGFSDWRLPDRNELTSIINRSKYSPAAFKHFFPEVMPAYYWSSTSNANDTGYVWGVHFAYGGVNRSAKFSSYYARAVRGRHFRSFDHLVINPDETITDTKTGLMWQKKENTDRLSWQEAINYCETLNESDHSNWRLPTIEELLSITDLRRYGPAAESNYFSYMLSEFNWSSTSYVGATGVAWGVDFYLGYGERDNKLTSYSVRAVRGGQYDLFGHLIIRSPNQASKWIMNEKMPILWDPQQISGNVQISLSRNGGKEGTFEILEETENDGLFNWSVAGPASVNCVLKIIPLNEPDKETSQSLFSIVDETSPTISQIENQYVPKNSASNSTFTVSDSDNGSLMVWANSSNLSLVANENINLGGMNPSFYTTTTGGITSIPMTITPAENITGTTTITLTTYDAGFLTDVTHFTLNVGNMPPEAFDASYKTFEDSYLFNHLQATTPGGSLLTYSITQAPSIGKVTIIDQDSGKFIYTPNSNVNGLDSFNFKASDGALDSNIATITVGITPVNDGPTAYSDAVLTPENTPVSITLTSMDIDTDMDQIIYHLADLPIYGSATLTGNRLNYTPSLDFWGVDTLSYVAFDGDLYSNKASIKFYIDVPKADIYTLEDQATGFSLSTHDLTGTLAFEITTDPQNGLLTGTPPNLTYTPNENYNGFDYLEYTINGGTPFKLDIFVRAENDPPVITNINRTLELQEDTALSFTLIASDVDNDHLEYLISDPPTQGVLISTETANSFVYSPHANLYGLDYLYYQVSDGSLHDFGRIIFNVRPVNDIPVAFNQNIKSLEDKSIRINLQADDIEKDFLIYEIIQMPENGVLDHEYEYTPVNDYYGTDSLIFRVYDGQLYSKPAKVLIEIENVNDPPQISQITNQYIPVNTESVQIPFAVSDPDNNQITIWSKSSNTSLFPDDSLIITGSETNRIITGKPAKNNTGTSTISLIVSDTNGLTTQQTFHITVYSYSNIIIATHQSSPYYEPGTTLNIETRIELSYTLTALGMNVTLPEGWTYIDTSGENPSDVTPKEEGSSISFAWLYNLTPQVLTFSYIVEPTGVAVDQQNILATLFFRIGPSKEITQTVAPYPLVINPSITDFHRLKVNVIPPSKGHISGNGINCPTECETFISDNTVIHLAAANMLSGFDFSHWVDYNTTISNHPELELTITTPMSLTAVFFRNNPPHTPQGIYPIDQELIDSKSVMLRAGKYIDPENNPHQFTWWKIRPIDQPYGCSEMNNSFCHIHSNDDLTVYEINGLTSGMKYAWKVGYSDIADEEPLYSKEQTFIVGQPTIDETVKISGSADPVDFRMMSLIQWPEQSSGMHVFGDELGGNYDTNNFRIGTYDPILSNYIECDHGLEIEPGRAYWILSRNPMPVQVNGVFVTMEIPVQVELKYNSSTNDGWNMIGCPNDAVYEWKKVKVVLYNDSEQMIDVNGNPISENDIQTIEMLGSDNRLISTDILIWNNGDYKQLVQSDIPVEDQVLMPYEGYWVQALQKNVYLRFDSSAYARKRNIKRSVYDGAQNETLSSKLPPEPIPGLTEQGTNIDNCFVSLLFSDDYSCYLFFGLLFIVVLLLRNALKTILPIGQDI